MCPKKPLGERFLIRTEERPCLQRTFKGNSLSGAVPTDQVCQRFRTSAASRPDTLAYICKALTECIGLFSPVDQSNPEGLAPCPYGVR
jgi:hypothetical protein